MNIGLERADRIVQSLWDRDAQPWEAHWAPIFRRFAINLVSDAKLLEGWIVLDIGTGTGVAAFEAAKACTLAVGIDRSDSMLSEARRKVRRSNTGNMRFLRMDGADLRFPGGLFDAAVSNCGFSFISFGKVASETFRVLRNGGVFAYCDWRLKDVPVHRMFSDALQKYRTDKPSRGLMEQRAALATFERYINHRLTLADQLRNLRSSGFRNLKVTGRSYTIHMRLGEYLEARFSRFTLRRELDELSGRVKSALYEDLSRTLRPFFSKRGFSWGVTFVRARKPDYAAIARSGSPLYRRGFPKDLIGD